MSVDLTAKARAVVQRCQVTEDAGDACSDCITAALRDLVMEAARAVCVDCQDGTPLISPRLSGRAFWSHKAKRLRTCSSDRIFRRWPDALPPPEPPQAPAVAGEEE